MVISAVVHTKIKMIAKTDVKARKKLAKMRHKAKLKAARPVHKKLIMHPVSVFLCLLVGVLLFGITYHTVAITNTVTAKVAAPPITDPASITSPVDGAHFSDKPIEVKGQCYYQSYIKLFRNGVFSGVAICQSDGTFKLTTDLSLGSNKLEAHIFNTTDDEGPLGLAVTVIYEPPQSSSTTIGAVTTTPTKTSTVPFVITSDYKYVGYRPGEQVSWTIGIIGGHPPYAFNIKWGDGNEDNYPTNNTDNLTVSHSYKKEGQYIISIKAQDVDGQSSSIQLFALINSYEHNFIASPLSKIPQAAKSKSWLWLAWPAYATFMLMLISFWLGERVEFIKLNRRSSRRR